MTNPPSLPSRPGVAARCLALLVLIACAAAAWLDVRPPAARDGNAAASEFSAARAMRHLPSIASRPHPVGSAENARVRAYLLAELRKLDLQPQVQTAFVAKPDRWGVVAGTVHNIVARLPGREPGPALALVAHYDSVTTGPGAADNGASVAAVLETLRALRAGAPLRNDVMVVFTDAEEADLLGAEAFVAQHPWARRIGLVLNFDFRGNRGPSMLFETSAGNGRLVAQFAAAAPHPIGGSLGYELYRRMPNSTDFKVFKQAGIAGLNFAAIEGHTHYHTQIDRIDRLQPDSVQHLGENMLAAARSFGESDLQRIHGEDRVFFNAPGLGMPNYGAGWAIAFTALAVALSLVLLVAGLRNGAIRGAGVARALPLFALGLVLAGGACQALWIAVGWLHPAYATLLQGDTYNSHWYLLAFLAVAAGVQTALLAATARWCSALEAGFAAMLVWTALLCWAAAVVPGAGYLLLWPLLAVQAGTWASLARPGRGVSANVRLAVQTAAAIPGVALFAIVLWALYVALTPSLAFVAGIAAMLLFGMLAPLLAQIGGSGAGRWAPWLAALALLAVGSVTAGFDTAHPRQNSLLYAQDAASGNAWWISRDDRPDAWTGRYLGASPTQRTMPEFFGPDSDPFWAGATPAVLAPPTLRLDAERADAQARTLKLTIASARNAPRMMLSVDGATVLRAAIAGVEYPNAQADDSEEWMLDLYGQGDAPLRLELQLKPGSAYAIRLVDASYEPTMMRVPRPEGMVAQPFSLNGAALVRSELRGGAGAAADKAGP
ncbi:M20/M25/M40 family metallo-hydrolase [Lysobacter yananisis]|uniref:M20/M25/M40 family metallo-hydrolase n=1 Tax=Lysobacter yananisis TaxID=1003114 RepID=A0ABY9P8G3_9GAMM|nr:M20/M25/M40 family metallo-hydrolase [Lysobacter yananisis]WMT02142.1 M20/M25/M40 family metallo-hydrolase [Lysobacter yananisis]